LVLASLVFLLQGLFRLSNAVTALLSTMLVFVYVFIFSEGASGAQQEMPLRRKALRCLVRVAGLLVTLLLVTLVLVWLGRMTGVRPAFLWAGAFALVGFSLLGWSYAAVRSR
jgi:hypothetical protein